jgi:choline dehydrogenase-like flavoprotein
VEQVDVVVIGSGYGGSIPAARLAEAGMKVLVLERGPRLSSRDFRQSDDPKYIQSILDIFVSSSNIAFRTGKIVGGASVQMDGAHFRMPSKSFEARDATGRRYWPDALDRGALDPFYAKAEQMLRIRQMAWTEIPKAGGMFAKVLAAGGASCERARMNYLDCVHCGFCSQGCTFDKKVTMLHSYLPLAEMRGAEIRPGCDVDHLEPMGTGYVVVYRKNGTTDAVWGQRVFVACGGIHTPALLQRSRAYLPNLSPHVGEHFNNNGELQFVGFLPPEFDGVDGYKSYQGMDNAGLMTFHWWESDGITFHPGAGFEPTLFAATFEHPNHPLIPKRAWGMEYKRFVEAVYPHRLFGFSTLGLADGHRAVAAMPGGRTDLVERDRTSWDRYLDRLEAIVDGIGRAAGVTIVPGVPRSLSGMTSAHLLSSCRMSERAEDGVVDENNQVWGYENLYISDASSLPYALGVNPALTISALSERCAEKVIAKG